MTPIAPHNDLQDLGQLLQLAQLAQAPQLEQQRLAQSEHAANIAAILHMLGLQQQGQLERQRLGQEAQYNQGRLGAEQGVAAETARHNQAVEGLTKESENKSAIAAMMRDLGPLVQTGQVPKEVFLSAIKSYMPEAARQWEQGQANQSAQQFNILKDSFVKMYNSDPIKGPNAALANAKLAGASPDTMQWLVEEAQNASRAAASPVVPQASGTELPPGLGINVGPNGQQTLKFPTMNDIFPNGFNGPPPSTPPPGAIPAQSPMHVLFNSLFGPKQTTP